MPGDTCILSGGLPTGFPSISTAMGYGIKGGTGMEGILITPGVVGGVMGGITGGVTGGVMGGITGGVTGGVMGGITGGITGGVMGGGT